MYKSRVVIEILTAVLWCAAVSVVLSGSGLGVGLIREVLPKVMRLIVIVKRRP